MADLYKKKIMFFRAYRDPSIGPKPAFAFHIIDMKAEAELHPEGIFVRTVQKTEHLVPWANVESVRFLVDEETKKIDKK